MPTKTGVLTRVIAIDALTHILTRRQHTDVALEKLFVHEKDLRPLDKAFIYEIVFGALRWLSKMDWIVSRMMNRPLTSLDPRVVNALRVGIYQIYYMDRVPERAAVAETVEAIKNAGVPNAAPFVNAILRRVAKKSDYFPKPDKEKSPVEYYSMHYAHPSWMVERWHKLIPLEKLEYLLINNNKQPLQTLKRIDSRSLPGGESDLPTYLLKTHSLESSYRPLPGAFRLQSLPRFQQCPAFLAGCYTVQDESAQLVTSLLAANSNDKVLDACAAPGGKSIYLWNQGVLPSNLTVCDAAQKRLAVLKENFTRVGLDGVEILHGDVLEKTQSLFFSKILLDAPCSAMGVIRRHPEIKWHRVPSDIVQCAKQQQKLLSGLSKRLLPGGEMVYAVCSFEPEETTEQIKHFLTENTEFSLVSPYLRIHDYYKKYVTREDELLIYSGNPDDLDGFYAVILKKNN